MKKILFLIFLSVTVVQNLHSQNNEEVQISGIVLDSVSKNSLEFATISFLDLDDKVIAGCFTDQNGKFKTEVESGNYKILVNYNGHKEYTLKNLFLDKDTELRTIFLSPSLEFLKTIEVSGSSSLNEIKLGKTVYNVEKDLTSQGAVAVEVLENVPSVSIIDGMPHIRGSKATIMINGRVSSMSKPEALQNLQASSIKKIEVITSPSAKNRASSGGGIINIILKKGIDNGWNGSVTATAGIKNVYGGAATLNYRKNNFSFYSNSSYFSRERIARTTMDNQYFINNTTDSYLNEDRIKLRDVKAFNTTLGIDYYLNDYTSLNIEGSFVNFDGNINSSNVYSFFDANKILSSSYEQLIYNDHSNNIYEFSTTYNKYFKREGENLFINVSFSNDDEINDSQLFLAELFPNNSTIPEQDELIYESLDVQNTSWSAFYAFPTSDTSTFEFGADGNIGHVHSDFIHKIIFNGDFITNPATSNQLEYDENWYGFYAQFISEKEKFSYLLSLRTETTYLDVNLKTTNQQNSQDYTDIFPSIQLEYIVKENKTLALTFQRGLQRVNYPNLNPFEQRISETTSYVGNINLLPYYANNFELSLLNTNEESKFTVKPSIYFRNYDNIWQYITVETGDIINSVAKLITTPVNLGYLNFTGIEFLANYHPSDKIEFNATFDTRFVQQTGIYEYTDSNNDLVVLDYENDGFGGFAELNSKIELGKHFHFQSLFKYHYQSEGAYSKRYGYGFINASLGKDLFNGAGSLTMTATDILNSRKTKRLRWTSNVESISNAQWKEPSVLLTFTYRFNQSKKDKVIDIDKKDIEEKY